MSRGRGRAPATACGSVRCYAAEVAPEQEDSARYALLLLRLRDSPAATAPPKLARRIRDHDGVPLLERDEDLLSVGPTLD
uniref:OSJNBa0036E02.2 protein n=1 Tax=Oryza sativa subsp. japonica TaxID=39947 RepID=Q7F7E9_ORYSJ|nr:OSJNBa0036E02.2 [Oryza sativa Japonica Group]